jgi:hypothetical protein
LITIAVLLLAVLLIASIAALTYIPNQFVKTHPWVSIDYVELSELYGVEFLDILVGLHNPTHAIHSITLNIANAKVHFADKSGRDVYAEDIHYYALYNRTNSHPETKSMYSFLC